MDGVGGDLIGAVLGGEDREAVRPERQRLGSQRPSPSISSRARGSTNLSAGIHSSPVPGCVDGWSKLHKRFGRLPGQDVFKPAIFYAREGYPVTERALLTFT